MILGKRLVCVKSQALKLSKIIKFKNKTLGFLENEDNSQNTNEIVPKEKYNNLQKNWNFLFDLGWFMFPHVYYLST